MQEEATIPFSHFSYRNCNWETESGSKCESSFFSTVRRCPFDREGGRAVFAAVVRKGRKAAV